MNKNIIKFSFVVVMMTPLFVFAQDMNLEYLIGLVLKYFRYAVVLIMGLAVVMFVWNVFNYFIKGGDDIGAKKEAGLYVMWSVIGFFVILSLWGLVRILTNTFNLNDNQPPGFFGVFNTSFNSGAYNGSGNTNNVQNGSQAGQVKPVGLPQVNPYKK